jgi:DNA (cytosine-5)-methyltransferase 1
VNYLSVFSGIEAASVAWGGLGFKPVGFSEIDPFSCAVLSYRFPGVKNYGDINNFESWRIDETIRIVVGGSPCQSYSIAGNRRGSKDARGKLMFTYGSLVGAIKPLWVVWENVPGVLSADNGRDFGEFLSMLEKCGYGLAWRILDAQFFGVPQRRRRVFVVGYFGDVRRAAAVLFDSETVPGDIEARRKAKMLKPSTEIDGGARAESTICLMERGNKKMQVEYGITGTLRANERDHNPIIFNRVNFSKYENADIATTLLGESSDASYINIVSCQESGLLRRITPKEAERLQGFPDDWTRVSYKNKPPEKCPDSLRYTAIGNSMAVPVMRWIGERIVYVEKLFNDNQSSFHTGGGLE